MVFRGDATYMGTSLELSSRGVQWSLSIRGVDGNNDARFLKHDGKPVTAEDIVAFLPNWQTIVWQRLPDSMFSQSASHAADLAYELDIAAVRDSALSHDDVINAFEAFMTTPA